MNKLTLDTPVKFLKKDLSAPLGVGKWIVGDWMPPIEGDLFPCESGYHYTTLEYWQFHCNVRMFLITPGDEIIHDGTKSVCRTAKLTEEVTTWNQRNLSLFASDCAERVAHLNSDPRVMAAIVAVRDYWAGKIGRKELIVAYEAANAANAANAAVYAASAADNAATSAARASYAAAHAACAAHAAHAAHAASYAASAAHAAYDAVYAAECEWQNDRLLQYLNGEVS